MSKTAESQVDLRAVDDEASLDLDAWDEQDAATVSPTIANDLEILRSAAVAKPALMDALDIAERLTLLTSPDGRRRVELSTAEALALALHVRAYDEKSNSID